VEPALLARALRGLPRVLLLAVLYRAAFHEAARGRGRLGPRDGRRDARRDPARTPAPGRRECVRATRPHPLPGARDPRKRRRRAPLRIRCTARGARERCAHDPRRVGPSPACTRPGQGECAPARLHRARTAPATLGPRKIAP
jgi:hypothetical protein